MFHPLVFIDIIYLNVSSLLFTEHFLKGVKGYIRWGSLRSEDIKNELNISGLNERIKEHKISWEGHSDRMDESSFP